MDYYEKGRLVNQEQVVIIEGSCKYQLGNMLGKISNNKLLVGKVYWKASWYLFFHVAETLQSVYS